MATRDATAPTRARRAAHRWERLSDEELLDLPLRELGLEIDGSVLDRRLARLAAELDAAGIDFRPHCWLSTEWFCPDGVPGFAIPFFLVHPRLARLERRHLLEVEGGTEDWCMKLLRHETAHALDNAHRLHGRRSWREVFGRFSTPYRETYVPDPVSEHYVLNLDYWYAQSHPAEDFAETFGVWLDPRSGWRERYAGWPALDKLEYVDALMREIGAEPPRVRSRARPGSLSRHRETLRAYWRRKQARYLDGHTYEYDGALGRVFTPRGRRESAARFLQRSRSDLRRHVSAVTGQHPYLINQVINELVLRTHRLGLRLRHGERGSLLETAALLTSVTMTFVRHDGRTEYQR